jgi:gas vesicle protein|tara:strand:+ start:1637 stop:2065 length:429 start_codon:yes stop_codon:yes gene_type:complete
MPKKPAPAAAEESAAPAVDPQKQYLMDQFGNLMEQVGDGFGGPLQEELVSRLEQTIADFHEEVNEMLTNLKENSEKRHERLKEIWDNPDASADAGGGDETDDKPDGGSEEMSEWEKKLEAGGDEPKEEEPKKKKGFFGRKKK